MLKDNTVIFKGGKKGISIILDNDASFEQIADSLRKKISNARSFFADAATPVSFKGKALTETEVSALIDIITAETDISITFVEDLTGIAETELQKTVTAAPPMATIKSLAQKNSANTYYHTNGLRSGQAINHEGSVVIIGDVNAGAEVVATGNIVVFGIIRGVVHAGASGDKDAFVCAISMQPIQLRIAELIIYFPKEVLRENKNKVEPVYAFVRDGEICILPVTN